VPEPQSYAAPVTDAPAPNTASWDMVESATRDTAPNFNLNETVMADAPANLYETVATEAPANPYETVAMDAPAAVPQPTFAPPPVPESFTPPTPEGFTAPPVAEPFIPPAPPTPEPFAEAKAGDAPAPGSFAPVPPPQNYTAPLGSARTFGREIDLPINVNEDERRLHTDARRFARLLVSEIKLYNEPKVQEGRESGNIYNLLREAIDRSRQMYDRRVAPPVASQFDYFHYELVNTLAEGDAGKLGQEYPGAAV
jgi:hypothetical protein